jgi:fatty acid desaturase
VTAASASAGSTLGQIAGALILALFWQQCGWLAHDFGHHQVFTSRTLNDYGILLVGNLYQGFSNEWWKNKHNTHHAVPNLLESAPAAHDGDPDIDTLPFLAWSKDMLAKACPPAPGAPAGAPPAPLPLLLRYQAFVYFPILFFARLTWALQSAQFVFRFNAGFFDNNEGAVREKMAREAGAAAPAGLKYEAAEKALILLHYAGTLALCFGCTSSLAMGLTHFILAQTVCGLLLAIAFGVGHNGMAVFDPSTRPAYGELQVATTRNVDNDALGLTGWFMGGLHVQIEHHLYPSVPRHNLGAIRPRVEALCKKHGVPYHSTTLWQGTVEVLAHLDGVVKDFPAV